MSNWDLVEVTVERTIVIDGSDRQRIVLVTTGPVHRLELATTGLQGPPGPPGPAGGTTYLYDRAGVPAATWPINHALGRHVHATVFGDDGAEITTDVDHPDLDNVTITFATPFSGKAFIGLGASWRARSSTAWI